MLTLVDVCGHLGIGVVGVPPAVEGAVEREHGAEVGHAGPGDLVEYRLGVLELSAL